MQLSAILLARVIAFIDVNDINPRGAAYFPNLVPLLVKRFNFQKFPEKLEDFDEQKGVEFVSGYTGQTTIDKLTVWNNGIGLDVRSSTDDAQQIIVSTLSWLKEVAGLAFKPEMITRWAFLSQCTFHSDVNLDGVNPAIANLASRISDEISAIQKQRYDYSVRGITLDFDRERPNVPVAAFLIQRRVGTPLSGNKYFSEAALPTDVHLALLSEFEANLANAK
jgi:hypothetical protein